MSATLTGNDTLVVNNRVIDTGLADGNVVELDFANPIANLKTGKNGNTLYALNASGNQCSVKIRALRGSQADQFLNNLLSQQNSNFAGFALLQGSFTKKLGDGQGNITSDTYVLDGGIFTKQVIAKMNTDGDVEQSVSMYELMFSNAPRTLF